jgi:hypothetical protein
VHRQAKESKSKQSLKGLKERIEKAVKFKEESVESGLKKR